MSFEALQGGSKPYTESRRLPARKASPMSAWCGLVWICFFAVLVAGEAGKAFAKSDLLTPQINKDGANLPLLLQADELTSDNNNDLITAKGNVEVYYKNYALLANELVYDRKANTLNALGNVRIKEPDGAVITADRITLTDDFRDGFLRSFKTVTKEEARISAANAYRDLADQGQQDHAQEGRGERLFRGRDLRGVRRPGDLRALFLLSRSDGEAPFRLPPPRAWPFERPRLLRRRALLLFHLAEQGPHRNPGGHHRGRVPAQDGVAPAARGGILLHQGRRGL